VKAAQIGQGAKVNHLSYIGDAEIGEGTNVGAGTVTCNYDGVMKHRTVIGRNAFIGSDTMLVAPVTVGDRAMTASGSVITEDVPEGALALGRAKQVNKPGLAVKLMERLKAIKASRKG
jgi:bifunctional UDP-N-acetylglucosamine pyrophosphorylase / glucosamine-1-phosphate N-acetyltransferase